MASKGFTATCSIRSIENGIIVSVSRGAAHGPQEHTGENYFAGVSDAQQFIADQLAGAKAAADRLRENTKRGKE